MDTGKVSVIMAVYNCENTICDAIDSIISQTYKNWELILCDDGSKDNTYDIICEYAEKYKGKIIAIKNEKNSKLPFTLNHCLKYATGKYIARMDGDDISYPTRFEKQIKFLNSHKDIDLVGTAMDVYDGKKIKGKVIQNEVVDKYSLKKRTCFCHATIMTYKYVYDSLKGYSLSKYAVRVEDLELWYRFFALGFNGANISEPLYRVTDDEAAISRKKFKYRLNESITMLRGYRSLNYSLAAYPNAFIPIIKGLVPNVIYTYIKDKKYR